MFYVEDCNFNLEEDSLLDWRNLEDLEKRVTVHTLWGKYRDTHLEGQFIDWLWNVKSQGHLYKVAVKKKYFSQLYLGVLTFLNQFYNSFIEITYIFNKREWR